MQRVATLTVLLALATTGGRAALINGSFETTTPTVPTGGFVNFLTGSSGITGWTVVGASGTEVSVVNTSFVQECCSFPAQSGVNWVDLTGDGTNSDTEGVEQSVATTVGDQYALSFYVGNVFDPSGIFGTTSTADVFLNGVSQGSFTNSCRTCTTALTWQLFSTTFVANTTSTTIEFLNGDPITDNSNGLDNVTLVDNGPVGTVPEPGGLLLVGGGLIGITSVRRRRCK